MHRHLPPGPAELCVHFASRSRQAQGTRALGAVRGEPGEPVTDSRHFFFTTGRAPMGQSKPCRFGEGVHAPQDAPQPAGGCGGRALPRGPAAQASALGQHELAMHSTRGPSMGSPSLAPGEPAGNAAARARPRGLQRQSRLGLHLLVRARLAKQRKAETCS